MSTGLGVFYNFLHFRNHYEIEWEHYFEFLFNQIYRCLILNAGPSYGSISNGDKKYLVLHLGDQIFDSAKLLCSIFRSQEYYQDKKGKILIITIFKDNIYEYFERLNINEYFGQISKYNSVDKKMNIIVIQLIIKEMQNL